MITNGIFPLFLLHLSVILIIRLIKQQDGKAILSEGGTGVTQRQFSKNICSEDDLRNLEISEHLL